MSQAVDSDPSPQRSEAVDIGELRTGALVVAVLGGAGIVAGLLWTWLAPRVLIQVVSGGAEFVDPTPPQFIAADAWFGAITAVFGVAAGILVWQRTRTRPVAAVIGLAVGGILGALIAWRLGVFLGRVDLDTALNRPPGTIVRGPLGLGAKGMLVVYPLAAVATWLIVDVIGYGLGTRRNSNPQPESWQDDASYGAPRDDAPYGPPAVSPGVPHIPPHIASEVAPQADAPPVPPGDAPTGSVE